jgi:uncharacterized LabA/DUF88 family protein
MCQCFVNGGRVGNTNSDIDLVVDILTSAVNLDMIIIMTGDGDFVRPIQVVRYGSEVRRDWIGKCFRGPEEGLGQQCVRFDPSQT